MKRLIAFVTVAALTASLLLAGCGKKQEKQKLHPSEVTDMIFDSVMVFASRGEITSQNEFNAKRNEIAAGYAGSLQAEGLDGEGLLDYGKVLYWGGQKGRAREVLQELANGDDGTARNAYRELITMEIEGGDFAKVEEMMAGFRRRFPYTPEYEANLYGPCQDLAGRYNELNRPEDAIRILMEELESLPLDAPYTSYYLADELTPLLMEKDRIAEGQELFRQYRANLVGALGVHVTSTAYSDSFTQQDDPIATKYGQHLETLSTLVQRLGMIGTEAPDFTFVHVYNEKLSIKLKTFRGKVMILDFWATWCMPCMMAFPELRELYNRFRDRGLAVLGITSFQGMYRDLETGETEGSREDKLTPDREIELTGAFIEKHGMTWPCAFSNRPVFDPEYGIMGIPTFVILDREGRIRLIQTGIGLKAQKLRMIEKLMKER